MDKHGLNPPLREGTGTYSSILGLFWVVPWVVPGAYPVVPLGVPLGLSWVVSWVPSGVVPGLSRWSLLGCSVGPFWFIRGLSWLIRLFLLVVPGDLVFYCCSATLYRFGMVS